MRRSGVSNKNVYRLAAKLQKQMEVTALEQLPSKSSALNDKNNSLNSSPRAPISGFIRGLISTKQPKNGPLVSIIIPVYNKVEYTYECLQSLSKQISKYAFRVIIVDNASSDGTAEIVGGLDGIKYIRNSKNKGFVEGCNIGVAESNSEIIVLLNNDTKVQGNWLDALVDRLLSSDDIGIVGSKIIYPNGDLQEAGSIIFSDGSGYNFGNGFDADSYEYNYFREVDYCSAASIAIRRSDFNKLGGFDKRYAPAYYEDTDLAMGMRYKLGKRVVFEPHSILTHLEGGTAGTDTSSGYKKYQLENQEKFLRKWHKELSKHHLPPGSNPIGAARSGKKKRLLVVDSIVPEFDRDSGSLRMSQILKAALKLDYDVTFYVDNLVATQPYTEELQSLGIEIVYGANVSQRKFYQSRENLYDSIILSRPTVAIWHINYCRAFMPNAKLIYDTVDLHYLRIHRQSEVENVPSLDKEALEWKKLEQYLMANTDLTLLVSYEEEKLLKKDMPSISTKILSNINPSPMEKSLVDFESRQGIIFTGDYSRDPNASAAQWLAKKIMPLVWKSNPDIKLTFLGSNPEKIRNLSGPSIEITGFVKDLQPHYEQARIFVCPLLYGAGVKGKVSESIAFGLPVVSTPVGIEGMHMKNGIDCLVAESAEDFAKQVIELYKNKEIWDKLSNNSQKIYEKHFSETAGLRSLKAVL